MTQKTPQHVAFIMDGNRRWAKKNALQLFQGHTKGADNIRPLVEYAAEQGIGYVTFWAFSTENWKRGKGEIDHIMDLFRSFITGELIQDMMDNNVRLTTIGDLSAFPDDIATRVEEVVAESKDNTKITVIMALNYGGREEILRAANKLLEEKSKEGVSQVDRIKEEDFEKHLYTAGMPDPDIVVRTGGDVRLSGYLPWQCVYSELFFTDTLWPDFNVDEFQKILDEYTARDRRFGK